MIEIHLRNFPFSILQMFEYVILCFFIYLHMDSWIINRNYMESQKIQLMVWFWLPVLILPANQSKYQFSFCCFLVFPGGFTQECLLLSGQAVFPLPRTFTFNRSWDWTCTVSGLDSSLGIVLRSTIHSFQSGNTRGGSTIRRQSAVMSSLLPASLLQLLLQLTSTSCSLLLVLMSAAIIWMTVWGLPYEWEETRVIPAIYWVGLKHRQCM